MPDILESQSRLSSDFHIRASALFHEANGIHADVCTCFESVDRKPPPWMASLSLSFLGGRVVVSVRGTGPDGQSAIDAALDKAKGARRTALEEAVMKYRTKSEKQRTKLQATDEKVATLVKMLEA